MYRKAASVTLATLGPEKFGFGLGPAIAMRDSLSFRIDRARFADGRVIAADSVAKSANARPVAGRKRRVMLKYSILAGAIASFFVISPAFAIGLTEADVDYLKALNVQIDPAVIRGLSPKQQARLHVLINDPTTADNPSTRAKNVSEAIAEFKKLQEQEVGHPGKLRVEPQSQIPD